MEGIDLKQELTLLLEKEVGFTGKFILDKQCRSLDIDPDHISSGDLDRLARKVSWAIRNYTGDIRARDIQNDILEYRNAIQIVDGAAARARNPANVIEAEITIVGKKLSLGMLDEAMNALETASQSLKDLKKEEARPYEIRISRLKGKILARFGDRMDEAVAQYKAAISMGEGSGQHYDIALSRAGLGAISWKFGEHKNALENYKQALKALEPYRAQSRNEKRKKKAAEALIKSGLGNVYLDLMDYDSAVRYNEDAIDIFRYLDNEAEVGRAYNNLARVYEEMGNYPRAIDRYERAIKHTRESGDMRMEGWALANLASALIECNKLQDARKHLDRAERILRDFHDPIAHSKLNCMWGKYHRERLEWSDSIQRFRKSLEYLENLKSPDYLAIIREEFGIMYLKKGDMDQARELLNMALTWYGVKGETRRIEKINNLLNNAPNV